MVLVRLSFSLLITAVYGLSRSGVLGCLLCQGKATFLPITTSTTLQPVDPTPLLPLRMPALTTISPTAVASSKPHASRLKVQPIPDQENIPEEQDVEPETPSRDEAGAMGAAMILSLNIYKKVISPLLPPACRFVPTCSRYGVQAIEEFGPTKGVILIAWRLLRCSPFGGKGYDPPVWPPVHYTYSSY